MYAQEHKWYVSYVPPVGAQPARDRKELLWPYLRQGKSNADNAGNQVWHCPANLRSAEEASYGFNTYLNGQRLGKIRKWSETVAICDGGLADQPYPGALACDPHVAAGRARRRLPPAARITCGIRSR